MSNSLSLCLVCTFVFMLNSILPLADCTHASRIPPHMNRSLVHFEIQLRLHKWIHPAFCLAGQSIKCTGAYQTPLFPALPLKSLSNQIMPCDSIHLYSWVKYFFRLVVTVTGSWQGTGMAGTIQKPFPPQWILGFIYSNLFWEELETTESFKWINFLQQSKKKRRNFGNGPAS